MNHETSDEMIPGHGRQLVVSVASTEDSPGLQSESQGYDGFEDLTDDAAGTAEEY